MRVLFLLRLWPIYGGGETVTITLANELVSRGHDVHVVYFKDNIIGGIPCIDKKIKVYKISDTLIDEFQMSSDEIDFVFSKLEKYLFINKINIIINQWWSLSYLKKLHSISKSFAIIHCHHTAYFRPTFTSGFKGTLKKLFKKTYIKLAERSAYHYICSFLPYVDKFIFLSPAFEEQFFKHNDSKKYKNKILSIANPLTYPSIISSNEINYKEKTVLFVGRMLEHPKRVSKVINIWKSLEQSVIAENWKLKIIGDGPDLEYFKYLASSINLKNAEFLGYQLPLPFYKSASILLLTSEFEGFGMILLEAQQNGVVPIVFDTFKSLHDIVENNYNGVIIPEGNDILFINRLKDLMENKCLRNELANNGINSCEAFSVKVIVDKWETLFYSLLNKI